MSSFVGTFNHTLDPKNRIFIPSSFREKLGEEFFVVKAPVPDKCLMIYTADEWERIEGELNALAPGRSNRNKNRFAHARVASASLDKQGRFVILDDFCEYAMLKKDVVVLGSGNRIELWDSDEWNKVCDEAENDVDWDDIQW